MTGMNGRMSVLVSSPLAQQLALLTSLRGRRILNRREVERIRDDTSASVGVNTSESAICTRGLRCYGTVKASLRTQPSARCTECRAGR